MEGQPANQHYSSLTQINRSNVNKLRVAWTYDTGEEGILETNPVVVGRVLYAYTASQKVIALDAVTGKLLWKFDADIKAEHWARGVSYWTDGQESRIFAGVMNYLYALDPATGKASSIFWREWQSGSQKESPRGTIKITTFPWTRRGWSIKI
jgi:quinoprotein glucose dehydrogenase